MERKIFNFTSEILEDLTVDKEGYSPNTFGETSNKFIWASCRFCGEPSRIRKGQFNKSGSACHKECRFKEQSISGSPFKDQTVRDKAQKTNLEKYGVEHACQNKEIANKISVSRLTKEGKDKESKIQRICAIRCESAHLSQNKATSEKSKQKYVSKNPNCITAILRGDDFWNDLKVMNASLSSACDKYGIDCKDTTTIISRDEFRDRYYKTYSFPKTQKHKHHKFA